MSNCINIFNSVISINAIIITIVMNVQTYATEGRFTFTSHTAGEHIICIYSNSSAWFGGNQLVRVYLFIAELIKGLSRLI